MRPTNCSVISSSSHNVILPLPRLSIFISPTNVLTNFIRISTSVYIFWIGLGWTVCAFCCIIGSHCMTHVPHIHTQYRYTRYTEWTVVPLSWSRGLIIITFVSWSSHPHTTHRRTTYCGLCVSFRSIKSHWITCTPLTSGDCPPFVCSSVHPLSRMTRDNITVDAIEAVKSQTHLWTGRLIHSTELTIPPPDGHHR